jgi:response regulator NasT
MTEALRIVVISPDLEVTDPHDEHAMNQAERSHSRSIGSRTPELQKLIRISL